MKKTVLCLCGPTATGKSQIAYELAIKYRTEIISADSRTIYKEISIGTAKPTKEMLSAVPHHFIDILSITERYDSGTFGREARNLIQRIFQDKDLVIIAGGSTLYIHSLMYGFDEIPPSSPNLRNHLLELYNREGITKLQEMLKELDFDYWQSVDKKNPHRLIRALEVIISSGEKYSSLRKAFWERPLLFKDHNVLMIAIHYEKATLKERILNRLKGMVKDGLLEEVCSLLPYSHCYPLQTFVYREFFSYLRGEISFEKAFELAALNTYRYAIRQKKWFKNYRELLWINGESSVPPLQQIEALLERQIKQCGKTDY